MSHAGVICDLRSWHRLGDRYTNDDTTGFAAGEQSVPQAVGSGGASSFVTVAGRCRARGLSKSHRPALGGRSGAGRHRVAAPDHDQDRPAMARSLRAGWRERPHIRRAGTGAEAIHLERNRRPRARGKESSTPWPSAVVPSARQRVWTERGDDQQDSGARETARTEQQSRDSLIVRQAPAAVLERPRRWFCHPYRTPLDVSTRQTRADRVAPFRAICFEDHL